MLLTLLGSTCHAVLLCCTLSMLTQAGPLDLPKKMRLRDTAMQMISGILAAAKSRDYGSEPFCDAKHEKHAKAIVYASGFALTAYFKACTTTQPAQEQSIKDAVEVVAMVKMCTPDNIIVAPTSKFKPSPPPNLLDQCSREDLNAAEYRNQHKAEFDDAGKFIEKLFPSCEYKGVGFLGDGGSGIVYRVKMNVGNVERAMKIAACDKMSYEIAALQILKDEPWVVKMYDWGREKAVKAQWDYYIMDLIAATVEKANDGGAMDKAQLKEATRLSVEAARVMHTKYGLAHNDFKNDNIGLIANDPKHIKVFDFGQVVPVTKDCDIGAYNDYWRIAESIQFDSKDALRCYQMEKASTFNGFLDVVANKMVFDGKAPATGKDFAISNHLYGKFIDAFVKLGWATQDAKDNKQMECTLQGGLFNAAKLAKL